MPYWVSSLFHVRVLSIQREYKQSIGDGTQASLNYNCLLSPRWPWGHHLLWLKIFIYKMEIMIPTFQGCHEDEQCPVPGRCLKTLLRGQLITMKVFLHLKTSEVWLQPAYPATPQWFRLPKLQLNDKTCPDPCFPSLCSWSHSTGTADPWPRGPCLPLNS